MDVLIDLSYLSEGEQDAIREVLSRDEDIQKREDARIKRLKSKAAKTNNPIIHKKIKMRTGEWFWELTEKHTGLKRSNTTSATIRASLRLPRKKDTSSWKPPPVIEVSLSESVDPQTNSLQQNHHTTVKTYDNRKDYRTDSSSDEENRDVKPPSSALYDSCHTAYASSPLQSTSDRIYTKEATTVIMNGSATVYQNESKSSGEEDIRLSQIPSTEQTINSPYTNIEELIIHEPLHSLEPRSSQSSEEEIGGFKLMTPKNNYKDSSEEDTYGRTTSEESYAANKVGLDLALEKSYDERTEFTAGAATNGFIRNKEVGFYRRGNPPWFGNVGLYPSACGSKRHVEDPKKSVSFSGFVYVKKECGSETTRSSDPPCVLANGSDVTRANDVLSSCAGGVSDLKEGSSGYVEESGAYSNRFQIPPSNTADVCLKTKTDLSCENVKPSGVSYKDAVESKETGCFERRVANLPGSTRCDLAGLEQNCLANTVQANSENIAGVDLNVKSIDEVTGSWLCEGQDIRCRPGANKESEECVEVGMYDSGASRCRDKLCLKVEPDGIEVETEFTKASCLNIACDKMEDSAAQGDWSREEFQRDRIERNISCLGSDSSDWSENSISEIGSYRNILLRNCTDFKRERIVEATEAGLTCASRILDIEDDGAVVETSSKEVLLGELTAGLEVLEKTLFAQDDLLLATNAGEFQACKFADGVCPKVAGAVALDVEDEESITYDKDEVTMTYPVEEDEALEVYLKNNLSASYQSGISSPNVEDRYNKAQTIVKEDGFGVGTPPGQIKPGWLSGVKYGQHDKGPDMMTKCEDSVVASSSLEQICQRNVTAGYESGELPVSEPTGEIVPSIAITIDTSATSVRESMIRAGTASEITDAVDEEKILELSESNVAIGDKDAALELLECSHDKVIANKEEEIEVLSSSIGDMTEEVFSRAPDHNDYVSSEVATGGDKTEDKNGGLKQTNDDTKADETELFITDEPFDHVVGSRGSLNRGSVHDEPRADERNALTDELNDGVLMVTTTEAAAGDDLDLVILGPGGEKKFTEIVEVDDKPSSNDEDASIALSSTGIYDLHQEHSMYEGSTNNVHSVSQDIVAGNLEEVNFTSAFVDFDDSSHSVNVPADPDGRITSKSNGDSGMLVESSFTEDVLKACEESNTADESLSIPVVLVDVPSEVATGGDKTEDKNKGLKQTKDYTKADEASLPAADETTLSTGDETTLSTADETTLPAADETTLSTADETTLSTGDETTLSTADETTLPAADETTLSTADETTLSTGDETILPAADETTLSTADETTLSTADETTLCTADETTLSTADETTLPTADETMLSTADETTLSTGDEKILPTADETTLSTGDETILPTADETTLSTADEMTLSTADETTLSTGDETILPTADETILPTADETTLSTADETILPTADETTLSTADETILPTADETTLSTGDETILPAADETTLSTGDETILPTADETTLSTGDETILSTADEKILPTADETILPTADETALFITDEPFDHVVGSRGSLNRGSVHDEPRADERNALTDELNDGVLMVTTTEAAAGDDLDLVILGPGGEEKFTEIVEVGDKPSSNDEDASIALSSTGIHCPLWNQNSPDPIGHDADAEIKAKEPHYTPSPVVTPLILVTKTSSGDSLNKIAHEDSSDSSDSDESKHETTTAKVTAAGPSIQSSYKQQPSVDDVIAGKETKPFEATIIVDEVSRDAKAGNSTVADKVEELSRSVTLLSTIDEGSKDSSASSYNSLGRNTGLLTSTHRHSLGSSWSVQSTAAALKGDFDITGSIDITLGYSYKSGSFNIHIHSCSDLAAAEKKKLSNPYVKTYLLPDKHSKRKTKAKKKTLNPVYNETLKYVISEGELRTRTLNVAVWHDKFGTNVFLGEVNVSLDTFDTLASEKKRTHQLLAKDEGTLEMLDGYHGEIDVALRMTTSKPSSEEGQLEIVVKNVQNVPSKPDASTDAYVKCYLLPDKSRTTKQKTPTVLGKSRLDFDHLFTYTNVHVNDLEQRCIELSVWEPGRFGANQVLGGIRIGSGTGMSYDKPVPWMDSLPLEQDVWRRMVEHPGHWVEGLLPLRLIDPAK